MKKQFKAFLKGLVTGVLLGLFFVHGGLSFITGLLPQNNLNETPVLEPKESEILTPLLAPTATSSGETEIATSTATTTGVDAISNTATTTPEEVPEQLSIGLNDALETLNRFIITSNTVPSKDSFIKWFSNTAPIEILSYEYELASSATEFCSNVDTVTETLHIRLNDRVGYAKDRQAEAVDEYFVVRDAWSESVGNRLEAAQVTFDANITTIANESGILFSNEKYTTFATDMTDAYALYSKNATLENKRLLSSLRIMRDERTATLNETINEHENLVTKAIEAGKTACVEGDKNGYLVLQTALEEARTQVLQKTDSLTDTSELTERFSVYESNTQTAKRELVDSYNVLKTSL